MAGCLVRELPACRLGPGDGAGDILDKDQLALHIGAHVLGQDQIDLGHRIAHLLSPQFAQNSRLEPDPIVAPPRVAGIGPRGRIVAIGRGKNEVEQMHGAFAVAGEIVPAHRAVGQIVVRALADAPVYDLIRNLGIGKGRKAAEAAAGGQLRAAQLAHRGAKPGGDAPHGALYIGGVPPRARIVDGEGAGDLRLRAIGQASYCHHGPKRDRVHLRVELAEHFEAGGTGGDDLRLAEALPFIAQFRLHVLMQAPPSAPVRGRAAAVDHEANAAGDPGAEMRVDAFDMPGRGGHELAAGEKGHGAGGVARLVARECRRVRAAMRHVAQGEIVMGGGHVAAVHHVPARFKAHLAHAEVIGADRFAKAA